MGFAGWLPFLQCTHGVLSFDHSVEGSLAVGDETVVDFAGGRGYIEKDHGSKFPDLWIWMQTNSFSRHPGTSVLFSVARIHLPLNVELPGFTAAVHHEGAVVPFASYSGARFEAFEVTAGEVHLRIRGGGYVLDVTANREVHHVLLYGPVNGNSMEPTVSEALSSSIRMVLTKADGTVVVDDVGGSAGLEVHGDVEWLKRNMCGEKTAGLVFCL